MCFHSDNPKKEENHRGTENIEVHRVLLISTINLVKLRTFVPLWQKKTFRSGLKCVSLKIKAQRKIKNIRLNHLVFDAPSPIGSEEIAEQGTP